MPHGLSTQHTAALSSKTRKRGTLMVDSTSPVLLAAVPVGDSGRSPSACLA